MTVHIGHAACLLAACLRAEPKNQAHCSFQPFPFTMLLDKLDGDRRDGKV